MEEGYSKYNDLDSNTQKCLFHRHFLHMKLSLPLELGCVNPHKQRGGLLCPCNRRCPPNQRTHLHYNLMGLDTWTIRKKKRGKEKKKENSLIGINIPSIQSQ